MERGSAGLSGGSTGISGGFTGYVLIT